MQFPKIEDLRRWLSNAFHGLGRPGGTPPLRGIPSVSMASWSPLRQPPAWPPQPGRWRPLRQHIIAAADAARGRRGGHVAHQRLVDVLVGFVGPDEVGPAWHQGTNPPGKLTKVTGTTSVA